MFYSCESGFQITFYNGHTVSVQWSKGNYCDKIDGASANTAEIGTRYQNGEWEHVQGWKTPEQVANFIKKISELP